MSYTVTEAKVVFPDKKAASLVLERVCVQKALRTYRL